MIVINKMQIRDGDSFAFQSPNAANQHTQRVSSPFSSPTGERRLKVHSAEAQQGKMTRHGVS